MDLYNRVYQFSVYSIAEGTTTPVFTINSGVEEDIGRTPLRLKARLNFSAVAGGTNNNVNVVQIYNLSPDERRSVASIENGFVVLRAGYGDAYSVLALNNLPDIYQGNIINARSAREDNDIITTFEVVSGANVKYPTTTRTFAKGATVESIVRALYNEVVEQLKRDAGAAIATDIKFNIHPTFRTETIKRNRPIEGKAIDALTIFLDEYGLTFTIQNTTIIIYSQLDPTIYNITPPIPLPLSMIKGRPEVMKEKGTGASNTPEIRIRTFFDSNLGANPILDIPKEAFAGDTNISGVYTTVNSNIYLDSRGEEWDVVYHLKQKSGGS